MSPAGAAWRFFMHRTACISIPGFALQLLALREPLWREYPLAVVTEEKPSGIVLQINRKAKDSGVRVGMRFSAALTVAADLHAGTVSTEEISDGVQTVLEILLGYSPEIEPFELCPGVFWINASGFERLYPDLSLWAQELLKKLKGDEFVARVSIGFSRFGSFLAAKQAGQPLIFEDPEEELRFSRYTPLALLPISPKASAQLKDLGIETVGAFADLPPEGVKKRFKKDVCRWYRFASGKIDYPIQPHIPREEFVVTKRFNPEVRGIKPVLLHFNRLLDHLLADVMKHNELVHTLCFSLVFEEGGEVRERVSPARPTVRPATLFRLLDLRLSNMKIGSNISGIGISAERVVQKGTQGFLFNDRRERDLTAGADAFALIRAELGNDAVQHAELRDEHLPEKRVEWTAALSPSVGSLTRVPASGRPSGHAREQITGSPAFARTSNGRPASASPVSGGRLQNRAPQLVRRMYLSCTEIKRNAGPSHHNMLKVAGPVRYHLGWWDDDTSRDYYYLKDMAGSLHWAYRNNENDAWSFQGFVS